MDLLNERQFFAARKWSNTEIRKIGRLFEGDAINVSGWDDRDKEGGYYREYFPNLSSYAISNYSGERGTQGTSGEIFIDLEAPLPPDLSRRYGLVFNHTTLEACIRCAPGIREFVRNVPRRRIDCGAVGASSSSKFELRRFLAVQP